MLDTPVEEFMFFVDEELMKFLADFCTTLLGVDPDDDGVFFVIVTSALGVEVADAFLDLLALANTSAMLLLNVSGIALDES